MWGACLMTKLSQLSAILLVGLAASPALAQSQKLPSVQEKSVLAPPVVHIDGKPTEWQDNMQAYNRHTEVYYTLSNDENNLYLLIVSGNSAVTSKLLRGGLTFTVAPSSVGEKQVPVRITYPTPASDGMRQLMSVALNYPNAKPGIETLYAKAAPESDSLLLASNRLLLSKARDVSVTGIPAIADSLVSIYNDYNIRVRATLNNNERYVCEMAIPLSYLGINADTKNLAYTIRVNGPDLNVLRNRVSFENYAIGRGYTRRDLRELSCTTDFKATYQLAGK